MPYSDYIANAIINSFENKPVGSAQKYSISFHESLQSENDVRDTVEKLVAENKIVASVNKLGRSIVVTDERL